MMRRRAHAPGHHAAQQADVVLMIHHIPLASDGSTSRRGLKTLDVREYKPMGQPIELRFYQRYTNHPLHASGLQFLSHHHTYRRWDVHGKDYIDYMHWGKETGQARLPHRHQRVAFDFHDALHPTKAKFQQELFPNEDSGANHPNMSASFDPRQTVFSFPEHWNRQFSKRRPGEGDISIHPFGTRSLLDPLTRYTDTKSSDYFKVENRAPNHGLVPGINQPFLGEQDTKMMQGMSTPINKTQTLTTNEGRFSKSIYINNAKHHQVVGRTLAKDLARAVDRATNAVHSKLVVLSAAQSGRTDYFCQGVDFDDAAHHVGMANLYRARAQELTAEKAVLVREKGDAEAALKLERSADALIQDALRHEERVDAQLREHAALMWRVFTAARPLMTIVNGKCRGTGCGVALLSKYAVTRDASEFVFDGPNRGTTPYGGLAHFLARPETSLKFPGLAEFVMLTGSALFAGDVLRLGWTDLFSTIPDLDFQIKEWFNDTEHMHNDAIAWQLGHLLEATCKMRKAHSGAVERCAISPVRAQWIEDAFADQPSVEAILATLTAMERLPLSDAHNTTDGATPTPFTIHSVDAAIAKLREGRMHYALEPWDMTAPPDPVETRQAGEVFTSYVLERRGNNEDMVVHPDRHKLRKWREQRFAEYKAYEALKEAAQPRHVYVRLEGCEGQLIDFEFVFDRKRALDEAQKLCRKGVLLDDDVVRVAMLNSLKREVVARLKMPADRALQVGWYLPTLDTCEVFTDEELLQILRADPGIEDLRSPSKYPPIYFLVKRKEMFFSEWAYAVKHQLLMQSPFALKATLSLLQEVRGTDGSEETLLSLSESLAKEFKYLRRLVVRPDFFQIGQHTERDMEYWSEMRDRRQQNIHEVDRPLRPFGGTFDHVFETNVALDGHTFQVRPRWSPRTLAEVDPAAIAQLSAPLDFATEGATELDVPTFCAKKSFIAGMVEDAGVEVVPGLGEIDEKTGKEKIPPLQSNASVPENVDFYEMARHPWLDTRGSWRQDGFTKGSQEYFVQQYQQAQSALYDAKGNGQYNYWPGKTELDGTTTADEETLLQDRFYSAFREGEAAVEGWAQELRKQAATGTLTKRMEIATSEEKIMDDEYYRWFAQPGVHPNPSGLLLGGRRKAGADGDVSGGDEEVQSKLMSFGAAVEPEAYNLVEEMTTMTDDAEGPVASADDAAVESVLPDDPTI